MQTRIITAAAAALLLIIFLAIGGFALRVAIVFLSFLMISEMKRVMGSNSRLDHIVTAVLLTVMFLFPSLDIALAMLFLYALISLLLAIIQRKLPLQQFINNGFAFLYVAIPMTLLYRLIAYAPQKAGYIMILLVAWGCDTTAYFMGNYFGTKKLAPSISPKKTVEGAIGGVLGAIILTLFFKFLFVREASLSGTFLFALLGSMAAQLGDLAASYIKRQYRVKDYGFIMPGHGGFLDRFDSVLVVTVLYYLLYTLIY